MSEGTNHDYIKALSVHNIAEMVYARQVFCEHGMLPGLHLCRMNDGVEAIPDRGWIVWFDHNGPFYDTMTDDEFLARFVPYGQLPENLKSVCDAHPDYDEWVKIMDSQYTATEDCHAHD